MFTSFSTALSALAAQSTAIDVVGNNLANLNTTGFKSSVVSFHDLVTQSLGAGLGDTQVGFGVGTPITLREFTQGAIQTTGTWNVGTRAGDFIYIAGMRGVDPKSNTLVAGDEARIRQGFRNMQLIAESEGASLRDCVRIVVYVTDMFRFRPLVNKVQEELWGQGPFPPRTIVEVHRLNQDDIFEVEGTFYAPLKK